MLPSRHGVTILAVLLLTVVLVACGGGLPTATPGATQPGDGTPTPSEPTPTPTPPATATPTAVPTPTPSGPTATPTPTPRPTLQSLTPTPANGPSITPTATAVVLTPVQDNTIWEDEPGTANGAGIHLFVGNTGTGSARRVLLKFDVAGAVPNGATILSASLQLAQTKAAGSASGTTLALHRLTSSWGEGTSNAGNTQDGGGTSAAADDTTWTLRFTGGESWSTAGGDFASTPSGQTTSVTWASSTPLMADVQSWLEDPGANHGWIVVGDEATNATARQFGSRESSNPPRLTITYQ